VWWLELLGGAGQGAVGAWSAPVFHR
jgi:hypothetical protein